MSATHLARKPKFQNYLDEAVKFIFEHIEGDIVMATPLAIGKPTLLINKLYLEARKNPHRKLTIITALTLQKPQGKSLLEKRFLDPMVARVFGNCPDLDFENDRLHGLLPPNIEIIEFYFPAGKFIQNSQAQQNFLCSNYTHVARDMAAKKVNLVVQMVARESLAPTQDTRYSLGSNPDVTADLIKELRQRDLPVLMVGQVNQEMPFMYGEACVEKEFFDLIIDSPELYHNLFAPPKMSINAADAMIGFYASTLVKDDGELQIGIGALGDAVVSSLILRHKNNDQYLQILAALKVREKFGEILKTWGDLNPFKKGLFGATEMLVDGFMELYQNQILKKKVYDHPTLQMLLDQNQLHENLKNYRKEPANLFQLLLNHKLISQELTRTDFAWLRYWGFLNASCEWSTQGLYLKDTPHTLYKFKDLLVSPQNLNLFMGDKLLHGHLVHAAFFVGPNKFYDFLRQMPPEERALFSMRSVKKINQLYEHEELDRLHRRNARFINTCMITTLLGAHASDTLANGHVVSGVGGQYNFVAMAHELRDGRSILTMRSTRMSNGQPSSNIVYQYGQTTIPRHLRDILITEYGIADLRGKTDREVIIELLKVADTRFQPQLLDEAKRFGKIEDSYVLPELFRNNYPSNYRSIYRKFKDLGILALYPFGTELTEEEQTLGRALKVLKAFQRSGLNFRGKVLMRSFFIQPTQKERILLKRMKLNEVTSLQEKIFQKLLIWALRKIENTP